ncbi:MAG TPA: LysR family transcriptional regulator, partial [Arthrobacter sp.]|nr:LysR family transcriptional regulator [Arthrobacter sp.]
MNRFPSPDDLLILLTVARLGRFTAVAEALETTHTTVSRRMAALDRQLGGRTLTRTSTGWELT